MAKPKLALIPATQGSKLYSVLPADGVGDFNFSRNTVATRINKDGLIETVAVGKSRLNYPLIDGVVNGCPSHLLEPQRTNGITYSSDFESNVTSVGYTQEDDNTISPDGTLNGARILETTGTTHLIQKTISVSSTTDKYTASFFVKSNGRNIGKIAYGLDGAPYNSVSANFNLLSKSISNINTSGSGASFVDSSIEDYGNGWFRVSISGVLGVTGTHYCRIQGLNDSGSSSYVGDVSKGFFVFGFQLEAGSFPTSYIPTTNSAVTRVAETANGAGDASTFNDSEGVLMAEISALEDTAYMALGSDSNNRVMLGASNGNVRSYNKIGGTVIDFTSSIIASNKNKLAIKYKSGNTDFYINGFKVFESSTVFSASTPFDEIIFGNLIGGTQNFYGNTKQIQYFDSALNDSDLETITSWTSFTDLANGQTYSIK